MGLGYNLPSKGVIYLCRCFVNLIWIMQIWVRGDISNPQWEGWGAGLSTSPAVPEFAILTSTHLSRDDGDTTAKVHRKVLHLQKAEQRPSSNTQQELMSCTAYYFVQTALVSSILEKSCHQTSDQWDQVENISFNIEWTSHHFRVCRKWQICLHLPHTYTSQTDEFAGLKTICPYIANLMVIDQD